MIKKRKQKSKITPDAKYKKQFLVIDRTANVFLITLFSLFPLVIFKDYTNITTAKLVTFLVLLVSFFALILFVFGGVFLDGYRPATFNLKDNMPFVFLGFYLIFCVLSILFSPERSLKNDAGKSAFLFGSGRYDGFLMLLCYILLFLITSFFGSFKKIHIFVIAGTLAVMSIIGIVQIFGINAFELYPVRTYDGKLDNFISTVGNFDFFSTIICIYIPIVVFSALLIDFKLYERILLLISGGLGLYILFSLNVSSGKLAVLVTLTVFSPFFVLIKGRKFIKIGIIIFAVELLLFIGFLVYIYLKIPVNTDKNSINRDFLTEISNILHGKIDETTGTYRVGIWLSALKMWTKHPILGTGMGSFMKTFKEYTNGELLAFSGGKIDTCHNEYLQILCVGGLTGFVSYMGFIVSLIVNSVKYSRKNKYVFVLLSGMFSYLVGAFFSFSIVITAPIIWAVMGSINNISRSALNEKDI